MSPQQLSAAPCRCLPAAFAGIEARAWNGVSIQRRTTDGFVNATRMCKANGREWFTYARAERTREYIAALAAVPQFCGTELVQSIRGGTPELQGTWIHPRLAVDLARWISPAFAVWMDGWFLEAITTPSATPHRRRRAPSPAPQPQQPAGSAFDFTWNEWDDAPPLERCAGTFLHAIQRLKTAQPHEARSLCDTLWVTFRNLDSEFRASIPDPAHMPSGRRLQRKPISRLGMARRDAKALVRELRGADCSPRSLLLAMGVSESLDQLARTKAA